MSEAQAQTGAQAPSGLARVWDPFVRLFHWSLVASFAIAYLTHEGRVGWVHEWAGYAAGGLVALRILWGIVGTRYARFSQFIRQPSTVMTYLKDIASGREARYIGHNPAGGAMVLCLLLGMLATAVTGWMMTLASYHHVRWVHGLHSLFAHGLVLLILAHLAGVGLASLRHNENLVRAMLTGNKRKAGPQDID